VLTSAKLSFSGVLHSSQGSIQGSSQPLTLSLDVVGVTQTQAYTTVSFTI
jgi:hypothetical protein